MVGRSVQYARERFFKGEEFRDLAQLREKAVRWCRDVAGMRIHGTTRRQPLRVFLDEERQALPPGTACLTRSPIGAPPRCTPITTWLANTPSTQFPPPFARLSRRWR